MFNWIGAWQTIYEVTNNTRNVGGAQRLMGCYLGELGVREIAARAFPTGSPGTAHGQSLSQAPALGSGKNSAPNPGMEQAVLGCVRRIVIYEKEPAESSPQTNDNDEDDFETRVAVNNDGLSRPHEIPSDVLAVPHLSEDTQLVPQELPDIQASNRARGTINQVGPFVTGPSTKDPVALANESIMSRAIEPGAKYTDAEQSTLRIDDDSHSEDIFSKKPANEVTFVDASGKVAEFPADSLTYKVRDPSADIGKSLIDLLVEFEGLYRLCARAGKGFQRHLQ